MQSRKIIGICLAAILVVLLFIPLTTIEDGVITDTSSQNAVADAYFAIFEDLHGQDSALNSGIKYLALDLSGCKTENKDGLIKLFEMFCENNGLSFLQDSFEGLEEKGYIKDLFFEEGILVSFNDETLTNERLVTKIQKWRSGLGAVGATYEAHRRSDKWEITGISNMWIS